MVEKDWSNKQTDRQTQTDGQIDRQTDKSGYKETIHYGRVLTYLSGLIDVLNAHSNKHVFGDLQLFCNMQ